ncbi:unnamed protein product [Rhizophagus irregularis]|nr:unnamed protein product [Rhizophagus irregularis]CAB5353478.1 unnamed protein product [Rhizophagus irregularis]
MRISVPAWIPNPKSTEKTKIRRVDFRRIDKPRFVSAFSSWALDIQVSAFGSLFVGYMGSAFGSWALDVWVSAFGSWVLDIRVLVSTSNLY